MTQHHRSGRRRVLVVVLGVLCVGALHFATRTDDPSLHVWHIFFRKLFFLPILASAVWFGLRGALLAAASISTIYSLHLFLNWPWLRWERMNQIGEMASFLIFAGAAGVLVEMERRAEARAEQARRRAERDKVNALVASLSETLAARDEATRDHSRRVARLASEFGRFLELEPNVIQDLYLAGILHDIGKIGIRDDVLHKPDVLTAEERSKIMHHPQIAEKILAPGGFRSVSRYVAVHHENWDGSGYPAGIGGEAIPFPGRILAIADTYDALRSDRPYHKGIAADERVKRMMAEMAGHRFDPELLARFWDFLERRKGAGRMERGRRWTGIGRKQG